MSLIEAPRRDGRAGRKRFLNYDGFHGLAAVSWYLAGTDAGMSISDCSRTVNLEMGVYNQDEFTNTLHKVRALRAAAEEMERALTRDGRRRGYRVPTRKEQMG